MSVRYADIFPILLKRPNKPAKRLRDISSISVTVTQESTPVQPMVRERTATGFTHGARKVTFEMESSVPLGGLEADWWTIQRAKEEFTADVDMGDGGVKFQLVDAVIDSIVPSTNAEGQAVARLSGKAIDWRQVGSTVPAV